MRIVLIGKNSRLYKDFIQQFNQLVNCAISHKDVTSFLFDKNDVVLLLSYSSSLDEQIRLMRSIHNAKVKKIIIFSSTACIVAEHYPCFKYPFVKLNIEVEAKKLLSNVAVIRLGTVVNERTMNLYRGTCVTDIQDVLNLCTFIINSSSKMNFFVNYKYSDFENKETFEYKLYLIYGWVISRLKRPCLMRPLDFILKIIFGYKWYGYGILTTHLYKKMESK